MAYSSLQNATHVSIYGAKFTRLLEFVLRKKIAGEQVVVFTQWTALMHRIKYVLRENDVDIATLEGNTRHRASILRRFTTGSLSCLILSLENSASGVNLPSARTVVFVHALMGGSPDAVSKMEEQAIGRVMREGKRDDANRVEVHHFIVASTQEETVWRKNHPELNHRHARYGEDNQHTGEYHVEVFT